MNLLRRWHGPLGTDVGAAIDGVREHRRALKRRLLLWTPAMEAVAAVVERHRRVHGRHARLCLDAEEVVREAEVGESRELADALFHGAGELVPRHVELLQPGHVDEPLRQRANERVPADVHHRGVDELGELRRDAAVEAVVEKHELVERAGHAADAARDASYEGVVREHHHGGRRVAEVVRDEADEAVAVDEDGVEVLVEEVRRQGAVEVVEPEVEVLEHGDLQHDVGEAADEAVVADVELVEEREAAEALGDDAAEAVGVDVEEGDIGEQAELGGEVARDVAAVEVDARDDGGLGVVEGRDARDAEVGAHVGSDPAAGEVLGVGVYGAAPGLERDVRAAQALVGEGDVHVDVELEVVGEVAVALTQGQQLPPRDVGRLGVRERGRRRGRCRCREQDGGEVVDEAAVVPASARANHHRGRGAAGGLHCVGGGKGQCGKPPLAELPIWDGGEDIGLRRGEDMAERAAARVSRWCPLRSGGCCVFWAGKEGHVDSCSDCLFLSSLLGEVSICHMRHILKLASSFVMV